MEYQEMAKYYDLFYKKKNYDKESTFLENLINKRKTILDVGCGTGLHMHYLEEKNYQVEGIDLNQGMLDVAKARVKGTLYQENLLDFPRQSTPCLKIRFSFPLHPFPSLRATLSRCAWFSIARDTKSGNGSLAASAALCAVFSVSGGRCIPPPPSGRSGALSGGKRSRSIVSSMARLIKPFTLSPRASA